MNTPSEGDDVTFIQDPDTGMVTAGTSSWRPTRKVTAVALAGYMWTATVAILAEFGVEMDPTTQSAIGAFLIAACGYWVREGA